MHVEVCVPVLRVASVVRPLELRFSSMYYIAECYSCLYCYVLHVNRNTARDIQQWDPILFTCRLEVHLLTSWTECSRKVKSLFFDNIASVCNVIANTLVCCYTVMAFSKSTSTVLAVFSKLYTQNLPYCMHKCLASLYVVAVRCDVASVCYFVTLLRLAICDLQRCLQLCLSSCNIMVKLLQLSSPSV